MCHHLRKQFFKYLCSNGAVQVRELCLDCGGNVRGVAINVPHAEVIALGHAPESLPELKAKEDAMPSLFDGLE